MLIAFLALGASVSSIVAWRFAASKYGEMSHDSCLHLSADGASQAIAGLFRRAACFWLRTT